MKLTDCLRKINEARTEFTETEILQDIVDKTIDGFIDLKNDIKDIANDLKKAIKNKDWKQAENVVEILNGTATGVQIYVDNIKSIFVNYKKK